MTKKMLNILISSVVCVLAVLCYLLYHFNFFQSSSSSENSKLPKVFNVYISGAVQLQKNFEVKPKTKIYQIIKLAHPLEGIDWSAINQNFEITKDQSIIVPFKEGFKPKINAKDGLSEFEISQLEVSANIKDKLVNLFESNKNVTWNDIDQISGVGSKTLQSLKEQIEL